MIWLGDLNYRLSLSELETWKLVKLSDWESLMKLDEVLTPKLITLVLQISYDA